MEKGTNIYLLNFLDIIRKHATDLGGAHIDKIDHFKYRR